MGIQPDQFGTPLAFIDDSLINIEAGSKFGITSVLAKGNWSETVFNVVAQKTRRIA